MADVTQSPGPELPVPPGPQGRVPLFAPPQNGIPTSGKKALGYSALMYGAITAIALIVASFVPEDVYKAVLPEQVQDLVWVAVEGPGGGGGGNSAPEPPKQAQLPKVEVPKPIAPTPEIPRLDTPPPTLDIPAQSLNAPTELIPGLPEAPPGPSGGGKGEGSGAGSGRGDGLGPGFGKGVGGGAYKPGNGVSVPRLLAEVRPKYTAEAMRARMQGVVRLECVVRSTGSVGDCDVIKSLDGNNFGLDEQALIAARQWRFAPGTRLGEPVDVLVTIELAFALR
jgi:periplasmic protein TonB